MGKPAILGGKPLREHFLLFGSPLLKEEEINEVVATIRSGWIGTGPKTRQFEQRFREYAGSTHAIALSSCSAGLHLALDVLGIRPGDEVITTPITFSATANAIVHSGARPVFADVERDTMNIDPRAVESRVTSKTRAIVAVHMAGRPCKMEEIAGIARAKGLCLIADAAHALESTYRGKKIGGTADISAFSFHATKSLTTAEGGMVTTENDSWATEIRIKSMQGISMDGWMRYSADGYQPYDTIHAGYKYNMTDIQASLGLHQLARVEENLKIRESIWEIYDHAFNELDQVITPAPADPDYRHSRHLYTLLIRPERLRIDRDQFIAALKAENIGAGVHFVALHLHSFYRDSLGYRRGDYPNAEYISDRTLSLPLSAKMSEKDAEDVVGAVTKIVQYYRV